MDASKIYGYSTYVWEIYLANEDWLVSALSRDEGDLTLVEMVHQYLEDQSILSEGTSLRQRLLHCYWSLTKKEFDDSHGNLIICFQELINISRQICPDIKHSICSSSQKSPESLSHQSVSPTRSVCSDQSTLFIVDETHNQFTEEMAKLREQLQQCHENYQILESKIKEVSSLGEQGIFSFEVLNKCQANGVPFPLNCVPENLRYQYAEGRQEFFMMYGSLYQTLINMFPTLCKRIEKWKTSHINSYIKVGREFNIELLKECCSSTCKLIVYMLRMLKGDCFMKTLMCKDVAQEQLSIITDDINPNVWETALQQKLRMLFERSFVVVKQPTEVQKVTGPASEKAQVGKGKGAGKGKKDVKIQLKAEESSGSNKKSGPEFDVNVLILCGEGLDCIITVTKPIKARFYYEGNQIIGGKVSAELSVPQASVDAKGMATFRKQKIKNYDRPTKSGKSEQVTSERYRIVFETEISLLNPEIHIRMKTMSLPMAIITGSNQASSSHGALLWYCFNNNPYDLTTPPSMSIPIEQVIKMLQACISYLDGRYLREDEVEFLIDKMLKHRQQNMISFEDFAGKSGQSSSEPTFWKWFQSILNLLEHYLKKPWQNGIIYGFVSKEVAKANLIDQPSGMFLLRFSESVIQGDGQNKNLTGAIVAAFSCGKDSSGATKAIFSRPLTVDTFFKKFSFGSVLSGICDEKSKKPLLKKLYATGVTIQDIKKTYNEEVKPEQDVNYPNWMEQTMLTLLTDDIGDLSVDDSDEDCEPDDCDMHPRRKLAKRCNLSISSMSPGTNSDISQLSFINVHSPDAIQGIPFTNAANEILQRATAQQFDLLQQDFMFSQTQPNIPYPAQEISDSPNIQQSLSTDNGQMLTELTLNNNIFQPSHF